MNDIYSFYQLISKYQIEIPIIQRDYAQGRDNAKAADVRKSIVEKMIAAVKDDTPLFFDFVYGRIDENKFIPFDGQQRLTTLFLFHKYVFEKCQSNSSCRHKGNCICKDILARFSYATRQSSRDFCEELVKANIVPNKGYISQLKKDFINNLKEDDKEKEEKANKYIESTNLIYRYVTNQSWFYPDWEKDPTVMGMLTMLDEIHRQMRIEENTQSFAEKLTSGCNCPITFHFVDMGEHKLSDETYVKMNARGKQLTPFENFKASLEQYLEKNKRTDLLTRFKGREQAGKYTGIDGTWLDMFWEIANPEDKEEKELPDSLMMSFFNRHFMNVWRCWYANFKTAYEQQLMTDEQKDKQKDYEEFNARIINEMPLYPSKDDFVSFDIYRFVMDECDVECCLMPVFNIFDALDIEQETIENACQAIWNRDKKKPQWILYEGEKNKDNRETYPSRVAFFAVMRYYGTITDISISSLAQWMRVTWNIIENSTIDSAEPYHAALRLINELSEHSHKIYQFLNNPDLIIKSKHADVQVKEEIAKVKQILDENNSDRKYVDENKKSDGSEYNTWEEIIEDAEKYAFFKGSIRFLFQNEKGDNKWNYFNKKWKNAKDYFDEDGVKENFKVQLTKALVIQCNNWNEQLKDKQVFNPKASTWKWILCSSIWKAPIHYILFYGNLDEITQTSTLGDNEADQFMLPILKDLPFKEFVEKEPKGRFKWNVRWGYYKPYGRDAILFDCGDFRRNVLLGQLVESIDINNPTIENRFWWGWDIRFMFNGFHFVFYYNNTICLMKNNWNGKKLKDSTKPDKPENNFYFSVSENDSKDSLLNKIECLIAQASGCQ